MILTILFITFLVLGLIFIPICNKQDWDCFLPALSVTIGVLFCFIGGALIASERSEKGYTSYYREWNRKSCGLEARIEAWNKGGEDPYLWDDVKKFNSDLKNAQHWANSYWTNWLNERACNEFETFDIPEYKRSEV